MMIGGGEDEDYKTMTGAGERIGIKWWQRQRVAWGSTSTASAQGATTVQEGGPIANFFHAHHPIPVTPSPTAPNTIVQKHHPKPQRRRSRGTDVET